MTDETHDVALEVESLCVEVATPQGWTQVVDSFDLTLQRGGIHGIVGESGSGKSLTASAMMGLLEKNSTARITRGRVLLDGREDLLAMSGRARRALLGPRIAMVFQEPMTSLNPVFTVGEQIAEAMRYHLDVSRSVAKKRAIDLLDEVGIPDAQRRYGAYPHEFSGGMRQRVILGIALSCSPDVLIADEPTTALDVTVQARILELTSELADHHGMSVIFISHDLGVVYEICDSLTVMYAGQAVEVGGVAEVVAAPRHPYTEGLLRSVPDKRGAPLWWIDGSPPEPGEFPQGCRFSSRCEYSIEKCDEQPVALAHRDAQRLARCLRADELSLGGRR